MIKKVALFALIFFVFASFANAGLILNVRISGSSGNAPIDNVVVGQTVDFDVYATFSGGPATPSYMLKQVSLAIQTTSTPTAEPTLLGDITELTKTSTLGNKGAAHTPGYDGLQHADWGGAQVSSSNTGFFNWQNTGNTAVDANGQILLGTFSWVATEAPKGSALSLFATPYLNLSSLPGTYNYTDNGTSNQYTNSLGNGAVVVGQALTISAPPVPEPATLVLLGMGALALVFIRRRK